MLVIEVDEFGHDQSDARWQEIRKDCGWCQCVLIRINPNGPRTMLTKRTMRSGNAVWGAHSAANQAAFHGVMDAVAAKVRAEIVPFIGGSHGPRKLKINHTKVSDAFKFNFHEDEKAQYQPDYMEGAHKKKDDKEASSANISGWYCAFSSSWKLNLKASLTFV